MEITGAWVSTLSPRPISQETVENSGTTSPAARMKFLMADLTFLRFTFCPLTFFMYNQLTTIQAILIKEYFDIVVKNTQTFCYDLKNIT